MKILNRIFFGLVFISLVSCAPISSPGIKFENYSYGFIRNIKGNWNKINILGSTELNPGQSSSENFYLKSKSEIFGPVHLQWENAAGKKFTKDFIFEESQLDFDRKHGYIGKDIYFYFTQEGVEMHISQGWPDQYILQKRRKGLAESQKQINKSSQGKVPQI